MKCLITLLLFAVVCAAQTPPTNPDPKNKEASEPKIAKTSTSFKKDAKIKSISDDRTELVLWIAASPLVTAKALEATPVATGTKPGGPKAADGKVDGTGKPCDALASETAQIEGCTDFKLSVDDQVWKDNLKNWRAGDLAQVCYEVTVTTANGLPTASVQVLTNISPRYAVEVRGDKKWALYASLGLAAILWFFLRRFIVGEDGFYSNSKLQMAIWFTIVIVGYLCTLIVRGLDYGAIQIPQNLLLMSGLSVISFGGAKLVTQSKVDAAKTKAAEEVAAKEKLASDADATAKAAAAAAAAAKAQGAADAATKEQLAVETASKAVSAATAATNARSAVPATDAVRQDNPSGAPNIFRDLFTDNNGKADLADFQMIVIAFLAAVVYVMQLSRFIPLIEMRYLVSLPDVDNTLLASFGLGQGAYLIKKAVGGVNQ